MLTGVESYAQIINAHWDPLGWPDPNSLNFIFQCPCYITIVVEAISMEVIIF